MRIAELCSGYGGLGLGLELAGINTELVWYAETDPNPAAVMAHHHPDAVNHGDLTLITDPPEVDMVTAGFPCQPVSLAGARNGTHDERWIIDDVCRVARLSRARWLWLENVPGLFTACDGDAMARVCQAMAHNGYRRWEWTTLRASDVGACHQRNRWFCLAYSGDTDSESRNQWRIAASDETESGRARADVGRPDRAPAADTDGGPVRHQQEQIGRRDGPAITRSDKQAATDTADIGHERARLTRRRRPRPENSCSATWGPYALAVERWTGIMGTNPPNPTTNGRLNPSLVEWMMGLPAGYVTDTLTNRAAALRCLGNGVVPQQAAAAFTILAERITAVTPARATAVTA